MAHSPSLSIRSRGPDDLWRPPAGFGTLCQKRPLVKENAPETRSAGDEPVGGSDPAGPGRDSSLRPAASVEDPAHQPDPGGVGPLHLLLPLPGLRGPGTAGRTPPPLELLPLLRSATAGQSPERGAVPPPLAAAVVGAAQDDRLVHGTSPVAGRCFRLCLWSALVATGAPRRFRRSADLRRERLPGSSGGADQPAQRHRLAAPGPAAVG